MVSDPHQQYLVVTHAAIYIWHQCNFSLVGHDAEIPFFGRGTIRLVDHWSYGVCLLKTSKQNACIVFAITHPPPWRASAVTALSILGALLFFMFRIAVCMFSNVEGSAQMGRSCSTGEGILSIQREAPCHPRGSTSVRNRILVIWWLEFLSDDQIY